MRKFLGAAACLTLLSAGPVPAVGQGTAASQPKVDLGVLHAQVILDRLGFPAGILDGRGGSSLVAALKGFQTAQGLKVTGILDQPTQDALAPYRDYRPLRRLILTEDSLAGPFYNPFPKKPEDQAKLPALGYASPLEKLAERFHTTPEILQALNPAGTQLVPGARMIFPNTLPRSRAYPAELSPEWRKTLSDLNVDAVQPAGTKVVVDKSDGVLRVYDADARLVAQFRATMGSEHDPLPIGTWKIQGASYNPPFHYNPDLFWDAKGSEKLTLKPGPNGPVGVVWLDLNKPHYGIHGTPEPQSIGRSESHGCIRLTNWDAARLSLMVKPGTPAIFQE